MNKTDYIIRQIAKSYHKKYENYVVTRIWHLLNNHDIKFVTQQHVTRPNGRALTDMYFPQIQLHIEVNESHHYKPDGSQVEQDIVREADIINATNHTLKNINIFKPIKENGIDKCVEHSIEEINLQIDNVVNFIKEQIQLKIDNQTLHKWDIEAEYNPQTYIERGAISVDDNVAFRTIADACNCFGHNYVRYQKALAWHAKDKNIMLWFPKLYKNGEWENEISLDENQIREKKLANNEEYFNKSKGDLNGKTLITFARVRSNLGDTMYRFKGVYEFDEDASNNDKIIIYKKVGDEVNTVNPRGNQ